MKLCKKCGAMLDDNQTVCQSCGMGIDGVLGETLQNNNDVVEIKKNGFFYRIKNILIIRKIFGAIGMLMVAILCFTFACINGFSAELGWSIKFGSRHSDLGIPIPNFLLSLILIGLGIGAIIYAVLLIKSAKKSEVFNLFMNGLRECFGNVDAIDESLLNTDKCRYAKSELRCNETYIFYRQGDDMSFIETASIRMVYPVVKGKDYFVMLITGNKEDTVKITTTKKHISKLVEYIKDVCSRKRV